MTSMRKSDGITHGYRYTIEAKKNEHNIIVFGWKLFVKHVIQYCREGTSLTHQEAEAEVKKLAAKERCV